MALSEKCISLACHMVQRFVTTTSQTSFFSNASLESVLGTVAQRSECGNNVTSRTRQEDQEQVC